jgi:hypothetical protein
MTGNIVQIAQTKTGDRYTQENPERFGPNEFDCSGFVWWVLTQAGFKIPGGPSNPAAAIVDPELIWLANNGGTVFTDPSQAQAGDIVGFLGSDAPGGTVKIGDKTVTAMGHIGIAVGGGNYISAYDTQSGVITRPIGGAGDNGFILGVHPSGGTGSPSGGGGSGTIDSSTGITGFGADLDNMLKGFLVLTQPATWFRIIATIIGVSLMGYGLYTIIEAAK